MKYQKGVRFEDMPEKHWSEQRIQKRACPWLIHLSFQDENSQKIGLATLKK